MEIIKILFETIYNVLIFLPKLLLAIFPMYNTLSNFNQNLIAAALGVSPILIVLLYVTIKILRRAMQ